MESKQLLEYLQEGIEALVEQGAFDNGYEFRPTQKAALLTYQTFLSNEEWTVEQRLKGFFSIPTGVGKTAVFIGIVAAAHAAAKANGDELKTVIVVPTTQLLTQTIIAIQGNDLPKEHPDYFEGFAPHLRGQISQYGDGDTDYSLPVTVMTYNAWFDLAEKGLIGSDNIDILISDEAHRGTSDRRVDQIAGVFDARTCQLAFTATAHFDKDKSVENSHEREIFDKPMDEVIGTELAAWVVSQPATIRVKPTEYMQTEDFEKLSEGAQIRYRRRLKQKAWNDFALETFREGRAIKTGEYLTENDTGFFVDGTEQANELEEMLNNDPVLQERAKARGKKGVAVAIHTGAYGPDQRPMSKKEQKRRFDAYLRGEYLAVIGDEKFKEGFDHSPMKTIFDYHRNSLVDKVQIIGRGARKWWNKLKDRFEGLTVIDTAIYIGDDDPDEDELARNSALKNNKRVEDVLGSSAIFGPDEEPDDFPVRGGGRPGGGSGGYDLFDDNPDVEYLTTLEEIFELDAEIARLRKEHIVQISDEDREFLINQSARTGFGGNALFNRMISPPEGLTVKACEKICDGQTESADKEYLEYIKSEYLRHPDAKKKLKKEIISEDDVDLLFAEEARTGFGGTAIIDQMENVPDGLTKNIANGIVAARIKSAPPAYIRAIKATYALLPSLSEPKPLRQRPVKRARQPAKPKTEPKEKRVAISSDVRTKFEAHVLRTGCKGTIAFGELTDIPTGLTVKIAEKIVSGTNQSALQTHIDALLAVYDEIPDAYSSDLVRQHSSKAAKARHALGPRLKPGYVLVDEDFKGFLSAQFERTGIGIQELFNRKPELTNHLSVTAAVSIRKGKSKSAKPEALKAIRTAYASVASKEAISKKAVAKVTTPKKKPAKVKAAKPPSPKTQTNRIPYTQAMTQRLQELIDKTGMGGTEILKKVPEGKMPKGLSRSLIANWQRGTEGATSVDKALYDFTIKLYERVLAEFTAQGYDMRKVPLDTTTIDKMKDLSDRTGMKASTLLSRAEKVPPYMTKGMLQVWFRGEAETARKAHIDWAIAEWTKHLE